MSFYRNVIAAVAAMGLATCVFADETTNTTTDTTKTTTAEAPADANQAATTQTSTNEQTTTTTSDKVDLNKANAKELMKVKGISAARAKAIITYRKKHGDFKAVEDLKEVKGFKKVNEKSLQQIEDQLTIG